MIRSVHLETLSDPEAMGAAWDRLLAVQPDASPFLDRRWFGAFARHMPEGRNCRVLAWREGDRLLAAAPLAVGHKGLGPLQVQLLQGLENVHTEYYGWLVDPTLDGDDLDRLARALMQANRDCSWFSLRHIPATDSAMSVMMERFRSQGCRVVGYSERQAPIVDLVGQTMDSFMARRSSNFRRNLRRSFRSLEATTSWKLDVLSTAEEIDRVLPECLVIETRTWKGERKTAILQNGHLKSFYTEMAEQFARDGRAKLFVLRTETALAAYALCLCQGDRYYGLKGSINPDFAAFGPFHLLMHEMVRWCLDNGFSSMHLLGKDDPYKLEWTRSTLPLMRYLIFPPALLGRTVQLGYWLHSLLQGTPPETAWQGSVVPVRIEGPNRQ